MSREAYIERRLAVRSWKTEESGQWSVSSACLSADRVNTSGHSERSPRLSDAVISTTLEERSVGGKLDVKRKWALFSGQYSVFSIQCSVFSDQYSETTNGWVSNTTGTGKIADGSTQIVWGQLKPVGDSEKLPGEGLNLLVSTKNGLVAPQTCRGAQKSAWGQLKSVGEHKKQVGDASNLQGKAQTCWGRLNLVEGTLLARVSEMLVAENLPLHRCKRGTPLLEGGETMVGRNLDASRQRKVSVINLSNQYSGFSDPVFVRLPRLMARNDSNLYNGSSESNCGEAAIAFTRLSRVAVIAKEERLKQSATARLYRVEANKAGRDKPHNTIVRQQRTEFSSLDSCYLNLDSCVLCLDSCVLCLDSILLTIKYNNSPSRRAMSSKIISYLAWFKTVGVREPIKIPFFVFLILNGIRRSGTFANKLKQRRAYET